MYYYSRVEEYIYIYSDDETPLFLSLRVLRGLEGMFGEGPAIILNNILFTDEFLAVCTYYTLVYKRWPNPCINNMSTAC